MFLDLSVLFTPKYSPRLNNDDLLDYYALSIALNGKELLRYSKDPSLSLKSKGCLNFLSHSLLLDILLTSAVIRSRLSISTLK